MPGVAPVFSTPVAGSATENPRIIFTWAPVPAAQKYQLLVSPDPQFTSAIANIDPVTSPISMFIPSGIWYVKARTIYAPGNMSDWSAAVQFKRSVIPAPTLLQPLQDAETGVSTAFKWAPVLGALEFTLCLARNANGPWVYYRVAGLEKELKLPLGPFFWKVQPSDGQRVTPVTASVGFTRAPTPAPTGLIPAHEAETPVGRVDFGWTPNEVAQWSSLEVSTTATFDAGTVQVVNNIVGPQTSLLLEESTWYWRVRSWDGVDFGAYSSVFTLERTAPVVPPL